MKVIHAFTHLFAILAFLTLGSLVLMMALHLLSLEDALARVHELYTNPWHSLQMGIVGLLFIFVGLTFAKLLIKRGRQTEVLIYQGETGSIVVSVTAIEDIIKKVLKRFSLVKEWKPKTLIDGQSVEIRLRLVLWSGGDVPTLLSEVQQEIRERLRKILGRDSKLEIYCDVIRIDESHLDLNREARTITI